MLVEILIYSMATWRIASLLVMEKGPFNVFLRLRELVGIRHDEDGPFYYPDNVLAGILSCVWCCSIWVAFFIVLFSFFFPTITLIFSTVFAVSTGAIVLDAYVNRE